MVAAVPERETIASEVQTALRHMAVYGVGGILIKAVGFLMLPFYTRYLTPADYGVLEILDLSMSVFGLLLNMGLIPAFLRSYATARTEEQKRTIVSTGCTFGVAAGVFTFLAGVGLVRPISLLLFGPQIPATYVLLSFSTLVLTFMANLPRAYLRALEASGAYTAVDTAYVLLLLVLNIFFIVVLRTGLAGMLWSSVIAGSLQFLLVGFWALRKAGVRFHWPYLKGMLDFGLPLIFSNLALFVLNFSDRFFLQHLRSLDVVGIYAIGYKFGYMMNYLIVQPFFVMWQSRMYAIHSRPDHPQIFRQFFSMYGLGLIYAGLAMSLFSPEVIGIMVKPQFAASQDVVPVVVLAYVFYGLGFFAQSGVLLSSKTSRLGLIGAAAALLNLGLNYFLIYYFGMMGAAWATALSFAFMTAATYFVAKRLLPLRLGFGRVYAGMFVAIGMYVLCRWGIPPGPSAVAVKVLTLALFPAVVWKFRILAPGAADIVSYATDTVFAGMWRACTGIARGAVNQ